LGGVPPTRLAGGRRRNVGTSGIGGRSAHAFGWWSPPRRWHVWHWGRSAHAFSWWSPPRRWHVWHWGVLPTRLAGGRRRNVGTSGIGGRSAHAFGWWSPPQRWHVWHRGAPSMRSAGVRHDKVGALASGALRPRGQLAVATTTPARLASEAAFAISSSRNHNEGTPRPADPARSRPTRLARFALRGQHGSRLHRASPCGGPRISIGPVTPRHRLAGSDRAAGARFHDHCPSRRAVARLAAGRRQRGSPSSTSRHHSTQDRSRGTITETKRSPHLRRPAAAETRLSREIFGTPTFAGRCPVRPSSPSHLHDIDLEQGHRIGQLCATPRPRHGGLPLIVTFDLAGYAAYPEFLIVRWDHRRVQRYPRFAAQVGQLGGAARHRHEEAASAQNRCDWVDSRAPIRRHCRQKDIPVLLREKPLSTASKIR
jgi:hypothetical protein